MKGTVCQAAGSDASSGTEATAVAEPERTDRGGQPMSALVVVIIVVVIVAVIGLAL